MAVRLTAAAMSVGGVSLTLAATTGMVVASAKSASSAIDSCGYPNSSSARAAVFNENTLTRAVQVVGTGTSARVVVFSNDENGVLLGVGDATHFTGLCAQRAPARPVPKSAQAGPERYAAGQVTVLPTATLPVRAPVLVASPAPPPAVTPIAAPTAAPDGSTPAPPATTVPRPGLLAHHGAIPDHVPGADALGADLDDRQPHDDHIGPAHHHLDHDDGVDHRDVQDDSAQAPQARSVKLFRPG